MNNLKENFKIEISKLKDMSFKDKLWYIKEYYKLHIIAIITIIFIASSIINIATKKDASLTAFFINTTFKDGAEDTLYKDFYTYANLEQTDSHWEFDNSLFIDEDENGLVMGEQFLFKISTSIAARLVDIIIVDEPLLEHFASIGYLSNLEHIIPPDVYEYIEDYLIYKNDLDGNNVPVGIDLSSSAVLNKYLEYIDQFYFSLPVNTENLDTAILFLEFLYDIKK